MPGKIIKSSQFDELRKLQTDLLRDPANAKAGMLSGYVENDVGFAELQCLSAQPNEFVLLGDFLQSPVLLRESKFVLSGYDESIFQYSSLEGVLRAYAHCINHLSTDLSDYVPVIFLSLGFYTSSTRLIEANPNIGGIIHKSAGRDEVELAQYGDKERFDFLMNHSLPDSILFVDGPIFTGASTGWNFELSKKLPEKNCLPIFIVKNSTSDIINQKYRLGYNNDLHWAYQELPEYSRTPYFRYVSEMQGGGARRVKIFCYLKTAQNHSPCRLEMSENVFNILRQQSISKYTALELLEMTMLHQFILNGLKRNNQVRIIEIAEMYARDALKSTHIYQMAEEFGLTATMNESRGFN